MARVFDMIRKKVRAEGGRVAGGGRIKGRD